MVSRKRKLSRDTLSFISGSLILFHETVIYHGAGERPTLIMAALALMGLPFYLRSDEKNGKNKGKGEDV